MNTPTTITVDGVDYIRADAIGTSGNDALAYLVGMKVFLRTVTMHYTGHVMAVTPDTILLADAAWIADSGRFHDALATGTLNEVEPFPNTVCVGRGALVDITRWDHDLPRVQK